MPADDAIARRDRCVPDGLEAAGLRSDYVARSYVANLDEGVRVRRFRARPFGIESFRIEGYVDAEPVHAEWDGRWLVGTRLLCERVPLAVAVDEVFAEAGIEPSLVGDPSDLSPEDFMLVLLACCDEIDLAEYEVGGHRRPLNISPPSREVDHD